MVLEYPVNSNVAVYYNPLDPAQSVLEPGFKWSNMLFLLAGLVFLGFGIFALIKQML
jgi:hypothetical protein